jgi:hypothetical protein
MRVSDIFLMRFAFTFFIFSFSIKTWQANSQLASFLLEYSCAGASILEEWTWSYWGWSTSFEVVSQVSITLDLSYKSFLIICLHFYKVLHYVLFRFKNPDADAKQKLSSALNKLEVCPLGPFPCDTWKSNFMHLINAFFL